MLNKAVNTGRLLLRPVKFEDAKALSALQKWSIAQWISDVPWPRNLEELQEYILQAERDLKANVSAHYVIIVDDKLCGMIALHPRDGAYNMCYWLGENDYGQEIMVEAAEAFVDAFFKQTNAVHITSGAFIINEASTRIQERLGFATVGETLRYAGCAGRMMPYYETVLGRKKRIADCVA